MDLLELTSYKETLEKVANKLREVLVYVQSSDISSSLNIISNLNTINNSLSEEIVRMKNFDIKDFSKTNEQYQKLIHGKINQIQNQYLSIDKERCNQWNYHNFINVFNNINNTIGNQSVNEIYEQFKYGDTNYILFGKNGAGKTSLLKELSNIMFVSNSIVIPATRNIGYSYNIFHNESEINLKHAITCNDDKKTLFILSKLVVQRENEERRNNLDNQSIITTRILNAFNSLGMDRFVQVGNNGSLSLYNDGINPYSLEFASDGEKSSLYFIMVTLLAPEKAFLIIDEPENHLNGLLMKKLFDRLELERKDLKFVYSTHNINFIESRSNAEIVYLKKTNKIGKWEFNKFSNYGDLPLDVILGVEGTNDNVVFCEGESNNSYDLRLYQALYKNYQFVPSNGCDKVILSTNIFNKNSAVLKKKAYGIIDYDYRDVEYIDKLKKENVYVLKVNEIENAFLLEECLICMSNYLASDKPINEIKLAIINDAKRKIESIKKDYASKLLRANY